jgi:hypothetical protein
VVNTHQAFVPECGRSLVGCSGIRLTAARGLPVGSPPAGCPSDGGGLGCARDDSPGHLNRAHRAHVNPVSLQRFSPNALGRNGYRAPAKCKFF